jgi:hypothetical protein
MQAQKLSLGKDTPNGPRGLENTTRVWNFTSIARFNTRGCTYKFLL